MLRRAYLFSLWVLQFALVVDVVPVLGEALRLRAAIGHPPDGVHALLRFAIAGAGMVGASFALAGPLYALRRHRQRGALRFLGLPGWAATLAIVGATAYVVAAVLGVWLPDVDLPWAEAIHGQARAVALASLSLMAGGALAAELLRRSVAPPRLLRDLMSARGGRTEVVYPDDLRTHAR